MLLKIQKLLQYESTILFLDVLIYLTNLTFKYITQQSFESILLYSVEHIWEYESRLDLNGILI